MAAMGQCARLLCNLKSRLNGTLVHHALDLTRKYVQEPDRTSILGWLLPKLPDVLRGGVAGQGLALAFPECGMNCDGLLATSSETVGWDLQSLRMLRSISAPFWRAFALALCWKGAAPMVDSEILADVMDSARQLSRHEDVVQFFRIVLPAASSRPPPELVNFG